MNKLFHITAARNIELILKEGLIPCKAKGLNCNPSSKPVIWLTNNINYIVKYQAGEEWIKKHDPYVLTINVTPYRKLLRAKIIYAWEVPKTSEYEFFVEGTISPKHIISYEAFLV
jgi:hypothetical protein